MTKWDYLIKVLEKIWDARPLWEILLVLWKNWELNNDQIDWLISFMEEELAKTKDIEAKKKIQRWIDAMKRMKELEAKEQMENNERLSEIESLYF